EQTKSDPAKRRRLWPWMPSPTTMTRMEPLVELCLALHRLGVVVHVVDCDGHVAVLLAFAGRGHGADDGRRELALVRQHAQRRVGEQRIASADAVDEAVDETVDDKERVERLVVTMPAGEHALVAELKDQR